MYDPHVDHFDPRVDRYDPRVDHFDPRVDHYINKTYGSLLSLEIFCL